MVCNIIRIFKFFLIMIFFTEILIFINYFWIIFQVIPNFALSIVHDNCHIVMSHQVGWSKISPKLGCVNSQPASDLTAWIHIDFFCKTSKSKRISTYSPRYAGIRGNFVPENNYLGYERYLLHFVWTLHGAQ